MGGGIQKPDRSDLNILDLHPWLRMGSGGLFNHLDMQTENKGCHTERGSWKWGEKGPQRVGLIFSSIHCDIDEIVKAEISIFVFFKAATT